MEWFKALWLTGIAWFKSVVRGFDRGGHVPAFQSMVRDFHIGVDQLVRDEPSLHGYPKQFRVELIQEELDEFAEACATNDLVKMVDALVDILYVTFGSGVSLGVDLTPIFMEVHRANMAKLGGPVREDGKRLKPPGWRPPDVRGLLIRMYGADAIEPMIEPSEEEMLDLLIDRLNHMSLRVDDVRAMNDEAGTLAIHRALIETKQSIGVAVCCARSARAIRRREAMATRPHDEIALEVEP